MVVVICVPKHTLLFIEHIFVRPTALFVFMSLSFAEIKTCWMKERVAEQMLPPLPWSLEYSILPQYMDPTFSSYLRFSCLNLCVPTCFYRAAAVAVVSGSRVPQALQGLCLVRALALEEAVLARGAGTLAPPRVIRAILAEAAAATSRLR